MQTHTDALPFVSKRGEMQQWQQYTAGSNRTLFDALEKPEIGQDAFASYNYGGSIAVASAWLVIYLIAVAQPFLGWSLSLITSLL